jgi:hypothetical protein
VTSTTSTSTSSTTSTSIVVCDCGAIPFLVNDPTRGLIRFGAAAGDGGGAS